MSQNRPRFLLHAALTAFASFLLLPTTTVLADLYSVRVVSGSQGEAFVAGDDYGDYVINESIASEGTGKCGTIVDHSYPCYLTYYAGTQKTVYSFTPPTLPSDPQPIAGSGCNFSLSDYAVVFHQLCDNGHEIVSGYALGPDNQLGVDGVFDGPDPLEDQIYGGSLDGIAILSANGNLFYDDGMDETMNVAIDLSTSPVPEPSSLLLIGTAVLPLAEVARRRTRHPC